MFSEGFEGPRGSKALRGGLKDSREFAPVSARQVNGDPEEISASARRRVKGEGREEGEDKVREEESEHEYQNNTFVEFN